MLPSLFWWVQDHFVTACALFGILVLVTLCLGIRHYYVLPKKLYEMGAKMEESFKLLDDVLDKVSGSVESIADAQQAQSEVIGKIASDVRTLTEEIAALHRNQNAVPGDLVEKAVALRNRIGLVEDKAKLLTDNLKGLASAVDSADGEPAAPVEPTPAPDVTAPEPEGAPTEG